MTNLNEENNGKNNNNYNEVNHSKTYSVKKKKYILTKHHKLCEEEKVKGN